MVNFLKRLENKEKKDTKLHTIITNETCPGLGGCRYALPLPVKQQTSLWTAKQVPGDWLSHQDVAVS